MKFYLPTPAKLAGLGYEQNDTKGRAFMHKSKLACIDLLPTVACIKVGYRTDPTQPFEVKCTMRKLTSESVFDNFYDAIEYLESLP